MERTSPPAVCASVAYDASRRKWVPEVKLIYGDTIQRVECGERERVCICTGPDRIEVDGEEVGEREAKKLLGELWSKVEEHRKRVEDLMQAAEEMQTAILVRKDEDEKDDESEKDEESGEVDDDDKSKESDESDDESGEAEENTPKKEERGKEKVGEKVGEKTGEERREESKVSALTSTRGQGRRLCSPPDRTRRRR